MLIHNDFQSLPPKMFLMQVMDAVSKLYIYLWDRKNDENKIDLSWQDLSKDYHKNTFRSNLRKLNHVGLLNFYEKKAGISIELVDWSEEYLD